MYRKTVSAIMMFLLVLGTLALVFNIQPVWASGTIYIRADGGIDPPTAPIFTADNITYTLTGDITADADGIVIERNSIVLDGAGYTVTGSGSGNGTALYGRSNVTVRDVTIKNFNTGIWLDSSSDNTLDGNNLTGNIMFGIWLGSSSANALFGNNIANNGYGIKLDYYSSRNTLSGNNVTASGMYGIWVDNESSNETLSGNNVTGSHEYGIWLDGSNSDNISGNNIINNGAWFHALGWPSAGIRADANYNMICHNNFINNTYQYQAETSQASSRPNAWDDGYPSGGNYWSDYNGSDSNHDGIGDLNYTIDASNVDGYPLMGTFNRFNTSSEQSVETICNSTISGFAFNGTAISFNVSGDPGTMGFCRICIPTALMNDYRVFVNGTEVAYSLLPFSNSTQSYLYFTYSHSTEQVIVVPESPTLTILLLLVTLSSLTILSTKKRTRKRLTSAR